MKIGEVMEITKFRNSFLNLKNRLSKMVRNKIREYKEEVSKREEEYLLDSIDTRCKKIKEDKEQKVKDYWETDK